MKPGGARSCLLRNIFLIIICLYVICLTWTFQNHSNKESQYLFSEGDFSLPVGSRSTSPPIAVNNSSDGKGLLRAIDSLVHRAKKSHGECDKLKVLESSTPPLILDDIRLWRNALDNDEEGVVSGTRTSFKKCSYPPTSTCHPYNDKKMRGYSVIITYDSRVLIEEKNKDDVKKTSSLRTLFINILSLLTYPHAVDILVLINGGKHSEVTMGKDRYGKRILTWSKDTSQPITILFPSSPSMMNYQEVFHQPLFPYHPIFVGRLSQEIVLYLDGHTPLASLDGAVDGEEMFEAGFELVRRNSRLLVGREMLDLNMLRANEKINMTASDEAILGNASSLDERGEGGYKLSNFVSTCQSMMEVKIIKSSGMFLHRDFSCLVWHDVFDPFRQSLLNVHHRFQDRSYVEMAAWAENLKSLAISTLIPQISGLSPILYPNIKRPFHGTRREEEVDDQNILPVKRKLVSRGTATFQNISDSYVPRRRRKIWEENVQLLENGHVLFEHPKKRQLKSGTRHIISPQGERGNTTRISRDEEYSYGRDDIIALEDFKRIRDYFGTYVSELKDSCQYQAEPQKDVEGIGCAIDSTQFSQEVVPWILNAEQGDC